MPSTVEVTPWLYRPDGVVLERLEWLTDVIVSYDGSEQRARLRGAPRRSFEFDTLLSGRDRRTAENLLRGWQGRAYAVPVWMDVQALPGPVSISSSVIPIDTAMRDFHVGGLLGIATDPQTYEIALIDAIDGGGVTLSAPLSAAWPEGAEVFPMRSARMPNELTLSRFDGGASYGKLRFECVDLNDWPAATGGTTYRGFAVLETPPNWTEDIGQTYSRKIASFDPGVGGAFFDDESGGGIALQTHRWLLDGRAAIDGFRRWLYARQGRLSAFWLPTFAQDFIPVAAIGATGSTIDVEHAGYTAAVAQDVGRRDIRIDAASGVAYYRRITGAVEVSPTVERLTIDAPLGVTITPDQVRSISYCDLVRLDADAAEIAWWRNDVAESRLVTRGSRNDL